MYYVHVVSMTTPLYSTFQQPPVDKAPPIISDRPHQFWQSLDAWCSDITSDDMDRLQELLKSQDYEDEYFKVPALGTHYSQRWAMEDLLAEQREGSEPHGRNNEISNITPATIAQLDNKPGNANKFVIKFYSSAWQLWELGLDYMKN